MRSKDSIVPIISWYWEATGKFELIGGTYGQPMGTAISGESNIQPMVVGREVIRNALGYEMVALLEEEEFTHPQVPQLAALAGFRYASQGALVNCVAPGSILTEGTGQLFY